MEDCCSADPMRNQRLFQNPNQFPARNFGRVSSDDDVGPEELIKMTK